MKNCNTKVQYFWVLILLHSALLFGAQENQVVIKEGDIGYCINTLEGHRCLGAPSNSYDNRSKIMAMEFSPNGLILASVGGCETIKLWDTKTGRLLQTLKSDEEDRIKTITFNLNGLILASGSWDKRIKLWNTITGACIKMFCCYNDVINSIQFSPNGKYIACGSIRRDVRWNRLGGLSLLNSETGKCIKELKKHTDTVDTVAWSPDGTKVISGSTDKTINLWNVDTGECTKTIQEEYDVSFVAFNPDGTQFVSRSNKVKLWNADTFEIIHCLNSYAKLIPFSVGGTVLATSAGKRINFFNTKTGKTVKSFNSNHTDTIKLLAFNPDGTQLASGAEERDGTIKLWSLIPYHEPKTSAALIAEIKACFSGTL